MLNSRNLQRGVTLIELMVSSAIALIALSSVLTVYSATANHSSRQLQQAHLHQQLRGMMHLLSRDLKRAGYWYFAPDLITHHLDSYLMSTKGNRPQTVGSCTHILAI